MSPLRLRARARSGAQYWGRSGPVSHPNEFSCSFVFHRKRIKGKGCASVASSISKGCRAGGSCQHGCSRPSGTCCDTGYVDGSAKEARRRA